MTKVDINELYAVQDKQEKEKIHSFETLLKRCHKSIKLDASHGALDSWFVVPEAMIGHPLYDIQDASNYVLDALDENGFYVEYFEPNIIFISWDKKMMK